MARAVMGDALMISSAPVGISAIEATRWSRTPGSCVHVVGRRVFRALVGFGIRTLEPGVCVVNRGNGAEKGDTGTCAAQHESIIVVKRQPVTCH